MLEEKKKITIYNEIAFILANVILAFAVALVTCADFGLSMIVSPAYLLHLKTGLTFGQAEYVVGGVLFITFCIWTRKIKLIYFVAFLTCLFYGAVLDLFRLIPIFNTTITPPETLRLWVRIAFFIVGELLTVIAVALSFKCYIFPQVNDFFVKGVTETFGYNQAKFKWIYDICFLTVSIIMTLVFFGRFEGIKFGTFILAVINGPLLALFSRIYDKYFNFKPAFSKFSTLFVIEKRQKENSAK